MDSVDNAQTENYTKNETLAIKYNFLRDKMIKHYNRGCRMLNTIKIISAVLFVIFTLIGVTVSNNTGNKMLWLVLWIVVVFLNITVFLITDYCKYLVKDKVIPYLENDDQIEFGEYDIFLDDEDTDDNREEEE